MTENLERQLVGLIAADRLDIPISSMSGKLKRMKPKLAKAISLPDNNYSGERVYANVQKYDSTAKARTMSEAVDMFAEQYPRHGKILRGYIEETRATRESNLYFGMQEGCRLTAEDYLGVMSDLGFTESQARALYEPLMDASRSIARKRADSERSILIG
ncbi:Uncharacterised protein [uncultured archaeon]|nr:Uncharacterised protein [uncultured archaeon]